MISRRHERRLHDELLDTLSKVDRPGAVSTAGDRPLTLPGLEVDGLGAVRLPLGKTQARKLIKLCRQAPYGKGTETVVDRDVRRVWELDPQKFRLTNRKWAVEVDAILEEVKRELGLGRRKLEAHLYKLLLYEKGSFFLSHRDGEKLDRMVATLVISLPSVHEGGKLVVSHDGRDYRIAFGGAASGHELSYAAFYADCPHEVRPLRSGYRLSLVYNVTLARSRGKKGVTAPSYQTVTARISALLDEWRSRPDPQKLALTLDHRYTQDGLTLDTLKGVDRARARVLLEAAAYANCVAHLALVTLYQMGDAEGGYDPFSYSRRYRGRYGWSDEDGDASEYEMGEVHEDSLSASHWTDQRGKKVHLGEIRLAEDEIVSVEPLQEQTASREEFEGYTGNAGMTLERWYHRAAIVIWPRDRHFDVLCTAGTDASIGGFEPLARRIRRTSKASRPQRRRECLAFARAIIDSWKPASRYSWNESTGGDRRRFLAQLQELDEPVLVGRFLSEVMPVDGQTQIDRSFLEFCGKHGWPSFEKPLSDVIENPSSNTIERNAELLASLCVSKDRDSHRIALCTRLCTRAVEALQEFDRTAKNDWSVGNVDRSAILVSMVRAMLAIGADRTLSRLIDYALGAPEYDFTDVHLAGIFALKSQLAKQPEPSLAVAHWFSECREELERRAASTPREPTDYRRPHELSCNCGDCRELSAFLADPRRRQERFRVAKDRRRHLHRVINGDRCDLTHVTERRGSPYTLVCTKTTASYKEACRMHRRDLRNLSRLGDLKKRVGWLG